MYLNLNVDLASPRRNEYAKEETNPQTNPGDRTYFCFVSNCVECDIIYWRTVYLFHMRLIRKVSSAISYVFLCYITLRHNNEYETNNTIPRIECERESVYVYNLISFAY